MAELNLTTIGPMTRISSAIINDNFVKLAEYLDESFDEITPIEKGGTNATTAAGARTNLGVAPTNHASAADTYGRSSATNYGHVKAATANPTAAGTANAGTDNGEYARGNHVHPAQTTVSGNAGTATTLATARNIGLSGVTATAQSFNGSANVTIPITAIPANLITTSTMNAARIGAGTLAGAVTAITSPADGTAQVRNSVVVAAGTNPATLNVAIGTLIFIRE